MLRKARIILSVVIFGLITFYFLDFGQTWKVLTMVFIFWILRKYCQIVSTDWRIYSLYRH